jgi:MYXO-CTERM domain-containing protein
MIQRFLAAFFLLAFAWPAAAADTVIYYSKTYMTSAMVADLESALTGMGATVTTSTSTSWPTSYSGYKLVIILLPEAGFSSAQASALKSFVNGGGRLVIAGDWEDKRGVVVSGFYDANDNVNALLTSMGSSMQLGTDVLSSAGYDSATSTIASEQVTDGVTEYWIAASNSVSGGTALLTYKGDPVLSYGYPSGGATSCVPEDIIVAADVNLFIGDGCSPDCTASGANWTMWENLYYWGACDEDGDGAYSATGSCCGDDCDDTDPAAGSGSPTTWYADADGDGYGGTTTTSACSAPTGYVATSTDCDDTRATVHPGATETCNSRDDDCDGTVDEGVGTTYYRDADGDGYGGTTTTTGCSAPSGYVATSTDCDDTRSTVYPGATETCNSRDDDCDGTIDEGVTTTYYRDADGDGYGGTSTSTGCSAPSGYVATSTDCDDSRSSVYPGATETCNSRDDDCDGTIDEGVKTTYYDDDDGDGHGDASDTTSACSTPSGYTTSSDDCDDTDGTRYPGATELCDGIDNDCDGTIDEGATTGTFYADTDGDGYGDPSKTTTGCTSSAGWVANDDDCDDAASAVHPGSAEVAYDGVDQDCDGADLCDVDGDGADFDGASCGGDDCDDSDATIGPSEAESADGVDEDCDSTVDEGTDWYDDDGDGATEAGGDCDDGAADVGSGADEDCDGVDDDCDGVTDEGTDCYDDDGDGLTEDDGDCNDGDANVSPDLVEVADNGVDDDCDGATDAGGADADGDGYAADGGDCDDADASAFPGAEETADGADDDCDGVADEGTDAYDDDGDGFTEQEGDCNDEEDWIDPSEPEIVDGVDNDCDGELDEGTEAADDDGDGFSEQGGDCDDEDASKSPSAQEQQNGEDDDCDGTVDEGFSDWDEDGVTVEQGDCDDFDGWTSPAASEICDDGEDNDCDGEIDEACSNEADPTDPKCGCASGPGVGWLPAVLAFAFVGGRRRRTPVAASVPPA